MPEQPTAPTEKPVQLRGDYAHAASDYTVTQDWDRYSDEDHDIWRTLYARQIQLIERYAAPEFVAGARSLQASPDRIPRIDDTNRILAAAKASR